MRNKEIGIRSCWEFIVLHHFNFPTYGYLLRSRNMGFWTVGHFFLSESRLIKYLDNSAHQRCSAQRVLFVTTICLNRDKRPYVHAESTFRMALVLIHSIAFLISFVSARLCHLCFFLVQLPAHDKLGKPSGSTCSV